VSHQCCFFSVELRKEVVTAIFCFLVENGDVGEEDSRLNHENIKTEHYLSFWFLLSHLKCVLDDYALEIK